MLELEKKIQKSLEIILHHQTMRGTCKELKIKMFNQNMNILT